jgi:hypothetical protein
VIIEAVQKLHLPVPLVVDSSLEFYTALERQILLDLKVFHPRILEAGIWPLEYPADPVFLLSQFRDLLECGLYPFQSTGNLPSIYLRYDQALGGELAFPE